MLKRGVLDIDIDIGLRVMNDYISTLNLIFVVDTARHKRNTQNTRQKIRCLR